MCPELLTKRNQPKRGRCSRPRPRPGLYLPLARAPVRPPRAEPARASFLAPSVCAERPRQCELEPAPAPSSSRVRRAGQVWAAPGLSIARRAAGPWPLSPQDHLSRDEASGKARQGKARPGPECSRCGSSASGPSAGGQSRARPLRVRPAAGGWRRGRVGRVLLDPRCCLPRLFR